LVTGIIKEKSSGIIVTLYLSVSVVLPQLFDGVRADVAS